MNNQEKEGGINWVQVGARIRSLRKQKGLSQKAMAKLVGVTPGAICQVEKGTKGLTAANLVRVAEVLQVPQSVLLSDAEISPKALLDISKFFSLATRPEKSKNYDAILDLIDLDLSKDGHN